MKYFKDLMNEHRALLARVRQGTVSDVLALDEVIHQMVSIVRQCQEALRVVPVQHAFGCDVERWWNRAWPIGEDPPQPECTCHVGKIQAALRALEGM